MRVRLFTLLLVGVVGASCKSGEKGTPDGSSLENATATAECWEVRHDGRIYVLGSAESFENFRKTKHMPYTWTLLGEGPNGETVVVEASKDDPDYQTQLLTAFKAKHSL